MSINANRLGPTLEEETKVDDVENDNTAAKVDDVENDNNEVKKDSDLSDKELAYNRELMRHSEGYEPCEAEKVMYEIFCLKDGEVGSYEYEDGVASWASFN